MIFHQNITSERFRATITQSTVHNKIDYSSSEYDKAFHPSVPFHSRFSRPALTSTTPTFYTYDIYSIIKVS